MANLIAMKRRIGSIRSTKQITRAMELVSASKMRRAQDQAAASRDYRAVAYDVLARLGTSQDVRRQPLFRQRAVRRRLYVVLTSNTGLAGAYNANVLKRLLTCTTEDKQHTVASQVIAVGAKGAQLVHHLSDIELTAYYPFYGDHPTQADVQPLLHTVVDQYRREQVDEVRILYTTSHSAVRQEVVNLLLLPAAAAAEAADSLPAMNFEPDAETVVHQVVTRLIEVQLWQAVLESLASEQISRMVAMKNATDNATDLIEDYTLEYNTVRQSVITQEIAEITGGAEALRD